MKIAVIIERNTQEIYVGVVNTLQFTGTTTVNDPMYGLVNCTDNFNWEHVSSGKPDRAGSVWDSYEIEASELIELLKQRKA